MRGIGEKEAIETIAQKYPGVIHNGLERQMHSMCAANRWDAGGEPLGKDWKWGLSFGAGRPDGTRVICVNKYVEPPHGGYYDDGETLFQWWEVINTNNVSERKMWGLARWSIEMDCCCGLGFQPIKTNQYGLGATQFTDIESWEYREDFAQDWYTVLKPSVKKKGQAWSIPYPDCRHPLYIGFGCLCSKHRGDMIRDEDDIAWMLETYAPFDELDAHYARTDLEWMD